MNMLFYVLKMSFKRCHWRKWRRAGGTLLNRLLIYFRMYTYSCLRPKQLIAVLNVDYFLNTIFILPCGVSQSGRQLSLELKQLACSLYPQILHAIKMRLQQQCETFPKAYCKFSPFFNSRQDFNEMDLIGNLQALFNLFTETDCKNKLNYLKC